MPFMGLQCAGVVLIYIFPQISLWLPSLLFD
jgi:TRAP-type mannitol/chloroaromatic compound transport system permease large subunit